eukprot:GHVU01230853.1.p1 GENE.GHVU01230853.1~~GHVU01230853.1.p1  ORF type:complete len:282 (+),score=33.06 GHVU01230853.1:359-1204(+)
MDDAWFDNLSDVSDFDTRIEFGDGDVDGDFDDECAGGGVALAATDDAADDVSRTSSSVADASPHIIALITDEGANMLKSTRGQRGVNCVTHAIHTELKWMVKRFLVFGAGVRKARALIAHLRSGLLPMENLTLTQTLMGSGDPTKPQPIGTTRWLGMFIGCHWAVHNRDACHCYFAAKLPGKRSNTKEQSIREAICPSNKEWDGLQMLLPILELLRVLTVSMQSSLKPALHLLIPTLETTAKGIIKYAETTKNDDVIAAATSLTTGLRKRMQFNEGTVFGH